MHLRQLFLRQLLRQFVEGALPVSQVEQLDLPVSLPSRGHYTAYDIRLARSRGSRPLVRYVTPEHTASHTEPVTVTVRATVAGLGSLRSGLAPGVRAAATEHPLAGRGAVYRGTGRATKGSQHPGDRAKPVAHWDAVGPAGAGDDPRWLYHGTGKMVCADAGNASDGEHEERLHILEI